MKSLTVILSTVRIQIRIQLNIGVCIVVYNASGQVLLGKRKSGYRAGMWGIPGGRVKCNETIVVGAQRELAEETGIKQHLAYVGVVREYQEDNKRSFIHFVFMCDIQTNDVLHHELDKCEGWQWFAPTQLPDNVLDGHLLAIQLTLNHQNLSDSPLVA